MTPRHMARDTNNASAHTADASSQQDASAYFRKLVWSTEEQGTLPVDQSLLHSPQSSPFASIFGLNPLTTPNNCRPMANFLLAEPKRAPSAEELDLHEYTVHQQNGLDSTSPTEPSPSAQARADGANIASTAAADADAESQWVDDDSEDDILDSISEMISKAWYGSPLPPPLGPYAPSKPRSLLRPTRPSYSSSRGQSSFMPSWLTRPWQGSALLKRKRNPPSTKPISLRFAEQVLGEEVVAAVELIQRDILENPAGDPLPEATIKFFVKAGVRVATTWAHTNINRVFAAFGLYVAATCGAMHYTKRAAKWLAWRLPWGKKVAGPAVTFTADVLLPTPFFGPWFATYVILRVIITERNKALAAAKKEEATQDASKPTAAVATKQQATTPAAAATSPSAQAPAGSIDAELQHQKAVAAEQQLMDALDHRQQHLQEQQHRHLQRRRSLQRAGSVRLRNRQFLRGRPVKQRPMAPAEAAVQQAVAVGENLG